MMDNQQPSNVGDGTFMESSSNKIEPNSFYLMRHKFVEIMEELKLLRKWHTDKEMKIHELYMQNFQLQKSLEAETKKSRACTEDMEKQLSYLHLDYEEKMKKYQIDQVEVKKDWKDFIEKNLQDALTESQLENYHAKKTIQELEDKVKSLENAVDKVTAHLTNVSKLRDKWQDTCEKAETIIRRLEIKGSPNMYERVYKDYCVYNYIRVQHLIWITRLISGVKKIHLARRNSVSKG